MAYVAETVSIPELIKASALRTFFQPIVSVRRKQVTGMESLLRAVHPETQKLISPRTLFDSARLQGATAELDRAARNNALRVFANRGFTDQLMFLNVDLDCIMQGDQLDEMLHLTSALNISPQSIVIELIENQFDDLARLNYLVSRVREHGMLVAIDDVGAGHSNLERISVIKPEVIKIDRSLCGKLGDDHCTEEVFSALVNLGRRIGAMIVAEGIETRNQALVALERGADLLQGYLIMQPQPADAIQLEQAASATQTLAGHFRQHMTSTINENKIERRKHGILMDTLLCDLAKADFSTFAPILATAIRKHEAIECAYVLDHRGTQVTDTIFNVGEEPPTSLMFRPADKGTDHSLKQYYHHLIDNDSNRYVTDPYVSTASGSLCRTLSASCRDGSNEKMFVLCIDVKAA